MGSNYFPDDNNISNLFSLSAFNDASLVQFIHRNLAYLIIILYFFIFFKIYRNKLKRLYRPINFNWYFSYNSSYFRNFYTIKWCTDLLSIYAPDKFYFFS